MRFPRAREVPVTGAVSGAVFLFAYMNLASLQNVALLLAAWGVMYLIECAVRRRSFRSPVDNDQPSEVAAGQ